MLSQTRSKRVVNLFTYIYLYIYIYICLWNVVFLHYVIIVKVKKFESVERECDDLDVDPHAMIVLLILTIAFRSPATIVFPLLPEPLRHSEVV